MENTDISLALSTTMLARKFGLNRAWLLSFLLEHGYLVKGAKKHELTDKGCRAGGRYCYKSAIEWWPVWPCEFIAEIDVRRESGVYTNACLNSLKRQATASVNQMGEEEIEVCSQILRGRKMLENARELDVYTHRHTNMHRAKIIMACEELYAQMPLAQLGASSALSVIDYGCGQGLASMAFMEYLRTGSIDSSIAKLALIEPSSVALQRATSYFSGNVVSINKAFDNLDERDLETDDSHIKLHLLSNVLDMGGSHFDAASLAMKIARSQRGINYFVCVGVMEAGKLNAFMRSFPGHTAISSHVGEIHNPSTHPGSKPWQVVWNLFKVEL
jgi:hypothetical protein